MQLTLSVGKSFSHSSSEMFLAYNGAYGKWKISSRTERQCRNEFGGELMRGKQL